MSTEGPGDKEDKINQPPKINQQDKYTVVDNVNDEIIQKLGSLQSIIRSISSLDIYLEDKNRIDFLNDTAYNILSHIINTKHDVTNQAVNFLLEKISKTIQQTVITLTNAYNKKELLTMNFDIFELTLRRNYQEIKSLRLLKEMSISPSSMIEEYRGRFLWNKICGKCCELVDWKKLREEVIEPYITRDISILLLILYFLDYPNTGKISYYQWNLFLRCFGPFDKISSTLEYISQKGFLGIVNRITANEILDAEGNGKFLIRLSRTQPKYLAFSAKTYDGSILHFLNKDDDGNIIPVQYYIETTLKKYNPINYTIDLSQLDLSDTDFPLCKYAALDKTGYITLCDDM